MTTEPDTPPTPKTCLRCGCAFTTKGRYCVKCYKWRQRHSGGKRCICGAVLNEKSMCCLACWNAACRKALEEIKAKCGMRVEEAEIPERYRSQYREAE